MYEEAAKICQDIIDGKYGQYKLANHFTEIFGWGNETCPEIIWTVPSENAKGCDGWWFDCLHSSL